MNISSPFILVYLPRFGLGNKLILWAKANYVSNKLNIPCYVLGWTHFSVGPILRQEKSFRIYFGYFKLNFTAIWKMLIFIFCKSQIIPWDSPNITAYKKKVSIDSKVLISDLLKLSVFREDIIYLFHKQLSQSIIKKVEKIEPPIIGIHVRRGDFKKANTITPIDYYLNIITEIRKIHGKLLPVTIFSDGSEIELKELLLLEKVTLSKADNDLVDLIILSKSQLIVTSIGSSFSYWAGFCSTAIVIHHPDSWIHETRGEKTNKNMYEGIFDVENTLLIKNIKEININ